MSCNLIDCQFNARLCLLLSSSQVAQVFETIELSRLAELAPFTTPTQLEKAVVETAHSNGIQVRLLFVCLWHMMFFMESRLSDPPNVITTISSPIN